MAMAGATTAHTDGRAGSSRDTGGLIVCATAALSVAAATVHLWAAPAHLAHWWAYGAFFLACALSQGLYGIVMLRFPTQPLLVAGIVGNLAIVATYVLTHTRGIPVGPQVGHIEEVELLGLSATATELGIALMLTMVLGGAYRRWVLNAVLLLGALLWMLRFMGILP